MRLRKLPGSYAVARAAATAPVPDGLLSGAGLVSVTRTADELSVVAEEHRLAGFDTVEPGWAAFMVEGPLAFAMTGVLADLSGVLAQAGISLFAISTYDTDYILVPQASAAEAQDAWCEAGHQVSG